MASDNSFGDFLAVNSLLSASIYFGLLAIFNSLLPVPACSGPVGESLVRETRR